LFRFLSSLRVIVLFFSLFSLVLLSFYSARYIVFSFIFPPLVNWPQTHRWQERKRYLSGHYGTVIIEDISFEGGFFFLLEEMFLLRNKTTCAVVAFWEGFFIFWWPFGY